MGLSEDHGFYIESNSFHHRISLAELTIWEDLIKGFIAYIDTMKSITVFEAVQFPPLSSLPVNLEESWSLKKINKNFM